MAELSAEERQAHMQKWGAWMQGLAQQGKLVDGLPLGSGGKSPGYASNSQKLAQWPVLLPRHWTRK